MRFETIQESLDTELPLTAVDAMHLEALWKRLASNTTWWGETDEAEGEPLVRSVIRAQRTPAGSWMVRVSDAIGVIAIPGLQITVKPKIPLGHLLLMFAKADVWPRLDEQRTEIEQSRELFELITRWFLSAAEQLLRLGLIRDYELERQELPAVRGRLEPLRTSLLYYSGQLAFDCEYEDFTYNTPLNRLIRAAAHAVVASPLLPQPSVPARCGLRRELKRRTISDRETLE